MFALVYPECLPRGMLFPSLFCRARQLISLFLNSFRTLCRNTGVFPNFSLPRLVCRRGQSGTDFSSPAELVARCLGLLPHAILPLQPRGESSMTLSQLAQKLGCRLDPTSNANTDIEITGVAGLEDAQP